MNYSRTLNDNPCGGVQLPLTDEAKRQLAFSANCVLACVSRLFIFYFFRWRAVDC